MQPAVNRQRGLSLIEVAIGLIILGILMAGALALYRLYQHTRAIDITARHMEAVEEALGTYVSRFQRYPVPMAYGVREGETGYGRASALAGACNGGAPDDARICRGAGVGGNVLIGSLPFHDLNLPAEKTVDGYGRRFTYAVTERITQPESETHIWAPHVCVKRQEMDASGNVVQIECGVNNPLQDIAIISHGRDGKGAWTPEGRLYTKCSEGGTQAQDANCDNDGLFLIPVGKFAGDTPDYNDDIISVDILADSNYWQELAEGMHNQRTKYVGVGVKDPTVALDVDGNIKALKLRSEELCETGAVNCFGAQKIAGNDPQMRCGDLGLVAGIARGKVNCQNLMNSFTCGAGQVLSGITATGAPVCGNVNTDGCAPTQQRELAPCPAGQGGEIVRTRDYQCPSNGQGAGTWTAWSEDYSGCRPIPGVCRTYTALIHNSFNPTWEPREVGVQCPANQYALTHSRNVTACIGPVAACAGEPTWQESVNMSKQSNCASLQPGMTYMTEGCPDAPPTLPNDDEVVPQERASCTDECSIERQDGDFWCTAGSLPLSMKTAKCSNGTIEYLPTISGIGCDSQGMQVCP